MERWSAEKAREWYKAQEWPVGFNYVPTDAVNDVEMWMNETFHAPLIRKELGMAADLGFNTARVFLSFAVWENERAVFEKNFDRFLAIASENGIRVMPVLFDDCAFDFGSEPRYGVQPAPVPGVHNSRWVPSPGFGVQDDPEKRAACEEYVKALVGAHAKDERVLAWDLYNEPGNTARGEKCMPLLRDAFMWARSMMPVQPLTAGIWSWDKGCGEISRFLAEESDVISLHSYASAEETAAHIADAERALRPIFVTEWLHRPFGNRYDNLLPLFHEKKIGIWQWGLIVGKTQTNLSWSTMNGGTPDPHPAVWQHDLLYPDGTPYSEDEIACLKSFTQRKK